MAMLYSEGPIPVSTLDSWVKPESVRWDSQVQFADVGLLG